MASEGRSRKEVHHEVPNLQFPSRLRVFAVKVFGQSARTWDQVRGTERSRKFPKNPKKDTP
jgi:hypothetical protein